MRWPVPTVLGICGALGLSACSDFELDDGSNRADKKTEFLKQQRGRVVSPAEAARHDSPVYWLGPRYEGLALHEIRIQKDGSSTVTYGRLSCGAGDSDSCRWGLSLATEKRDREDFPTHAERTPGMWGGPICFNRLGKAIAVNCLDPDKEEGEETLLTGDMTVYVDSYDPRDLRSLTPPRGNRPPAPSRLTCGEMKSMPRWARRKVPLHLRPAKRCG